MYFMSGQQFMQSISEALVVDIGEDVVDTTVLEQIVLYTYKS